MSFLGKNLASNNRSGFFGDPSKMRISFLGLGKMGAPMARRLLAAGHEVTVWNRTPARAEALKAEGAQVASTAAGAAQAAEVVMTMLLDDEAHEEVLFGPEGVIQALPPDTLHISHSTISVVLSERLTAEHARHNQQFIAAPVFGRPNVAEEGRLWIVAAGSKPALIKARPLFSALARGVSVVGSEPREAHAVKLGGNFLISAMIHSLAESFVYAEAQGIQPEAFLDTINSALFQSPFYASYGQVMLHPPKTPGATIELGAKDLRLLREAAASRDTGLSLADTLADFFSQAGEAGLGAEDWAVGQYRMAQRRGALDKKPASLP
jgi:3-hydroxyisobutyrate dehydrogenase-like beta-hydroxyacid dehydrogenase